jgi:uncharacterized membrane protein YczE
MKLIIFNVSLLVGLVLVGVGVGVEFGVGFGILAAGALIVCLTVYVQRAAGVKAKG